MPNPRVCLMLQTSGTGRIPMWRVRAGQHPSRTRKILWERPAAELTKADAIATARAWCAREGWRLIVNEAWLV